MSDSEGAPRPPVQGLAPASNERQQGAQRFSPSQSSHGRLYRHDRLCLQWSPCSASAFRQREQLGEILGGVRFPECVAKRSLAVRPRLGKLCQIQASHYNNLKSLDIRSHGGRLQKRAASIFVVSKQCLEGGFLCSPKAKRLTIAGSSSCCASWFRPANAAVRKQRTSPNESLHNLALRSFFPSDFSLHMLNSY